MDFARMPRSPVASAPASQFAEFRQPPAAFRPAPFLVFNDEYSPGKGEAAITCVSNNCSGEVQSYKITSHDIRLGMRWLIADSAPYVAPPLVRKY